MASGSELSGRARCSGANSVQPSTPRASFCSALASCAARTLTSHRAIAGRSWSAERSVLVASLQSGPARSSIVPAASPPSPVPVVAHAASPATPSRPSFPIEQDDAGSALMYSGSLSADLAVPTASPTAIVPTLTFRSGTSGMAPPTASVAKSTSPGTLASRFDRRRKAVPSLLKIATAPVSLRSSVGTLTLLPPFVVASRCSHFVSCWLSTGTTT